MNIGCCKGFPMKLKKLLLKSPYSYFEGLAKCFHVGLDQETGIALIQDIEKVKKSAELFIKMSNSYLFCFVRKRVINKSHKIRERH